MVKFLSVCLLFASFAAGFCDDAQEGSPLQNPIALYYTSKPAKQKMIAQLSAYYDALVVTKSDLVEYYETMGITIPVFFVSNYEDQRDLQAPQKLIFTKINQFKNGVLYTNSPKLYQKYLAQMPKISYARSEPLIELLRILHPPTAPSGVEGIDCVYVINLDERPERWEWVKKQFDLQNINPYRVSGINGWKIPKEQALHLFDKDADLIKYPFGGVLGCLLSHVSIYKNALEQGFKTIWICEDDIEFKQSKETISRLVKQLTELDPEWDVLYTDYTLKGIGTQVPRPGQNFYTQIDTPVSEELVRIHGRLNTHSMIFSRRGLEKVYAYFTRGLLWSPIDVDIHYTPGLKEYSTKQDIVTSIHDSSILATDGSSDTQYVSPLNPEK
jgi:GR25 family glycosyltransferase involved in LPS biosynthesis